MHAHSSRICSRRLIHAAVALPAAEVSMVTQVLAGQVLHPKPCIDISAAAWQRILVQLSGPTELWHVARLAASVFVVALLAVLKALQRSDCYA